MTKTKGDFGVRVKELRKLLHLTQEAMAETLGVSFATVNRWENGWTKPSHLAARQIVQLCERNNVPSVGIGVGKTNDKLCDDNN
jgi:DNA-binding transcriptional regulator YiaG